VARIAAEPILDAKLDLRVRQHLLDARALDLARRERVVRDARKINALIVSHGHYDHFGGLQGFLDKFRDVLPADVKLYGGCHLFRGQLAWRANAFPTSTFMSTRPASTSKARGSL
jgi:metal-dependent hydrolase (beta-lactamase superfamily II)